MRVCLLLFFCLSISPYIASQLIISHMLIVVMFVRRSHWPAALQSALHQPLVMSAVGGMVSYFKRLLIDKTLMSQARFLDYNPLEHGSSLMLDGQVSACMNA